MEKNIRKFGYAFSVIILVIGVILQVLHYQYGGILFALGIFFLLSTHLYLFILKKPKDLIDYAKYLTIVSFVLNYLFAVLYWPYRFILNTAFLIFLGLFIVLAFYNLIFKLNPDETDGILKPRTNSYGSLIKTMYGLSALALIIGTVFKIMHWLNGNFILIFGLVLIGLTFLIDSLKRSNANKS